jgi:hypothetical protein
MIRSKACRWAAAVMAATSRWAWAPSSRARSGLSSRDSIAADQAATSGGLAHAEPGALVVINDDAHEFFLV